MIRKNWLKKTFIFVGAATHNMDASRFYGALKEVRRKL